MNTMYGVTSGRRYHRPKCSYIASALWSDLWTATEVRNRRKSGDNYWRDEPFIPCSICCPEPINLPPPVSPPLPESASLLEWFSREFVVACPCCDRRLPALTATRPWRDRIPAHLCHPGTRCAASGFILVRTEAT